MVVLFAGSLAAWLRSGDARRQPNVKANVKEDLWSVKSSNQIGSSSARFVSLLWTDTVSECVLKSADLLPIPARATISVIWLSSNWSSNGMRNLEKNIASQTVEPVTLAVPFVEVASIAVGVVFLFILRGVSSFLEHEPDERRHREQRRHDE